MRRGLKKMVPLHVQQRVHRTLPAPVWRVIRDVGSGTTAWQQRRQEAQLERVLGAAAAEIDGPVTAVRYRGERLLARPVERFRASDTLAANAASVADTLEARQASGACSWMPRPRGVASWPSPRRTATRRGQPCAVPPRSSPSTSGEVRPRGNRPSIRLAVLTEDDAAAKASHRLEDVGNVRRLEGAAEFLAMSIGGRRAWLRLIDF